MYNFTLDELLDASFGTPHQRFLIAQPPNNGWITESNENTSHNSYSLAQSSKVARELVSNATEDIFKVESDDVIDQRRSTSKEGES